MYKIKLYNTTLNEDLMRALFKHRESSFYTLSWVHGEWWCCLSTTSHHVPGTHGGQLHAGGRHGLNPPTATGVITWNIANRSRSTDGLSETIPIQSQYINKVHIKAKMATQNHEDNSIKKLLVWVFIKRYKPKSFSSQSINSRFLT